MKAAEPLSTIQLAIRYARNGDKVLLQPGLYKGGQDCTTFSGAFHGALMRQCNYNLNFMGKTITIDETSHATIDCEGVSGGKRPRHGFIFANGETQASVLKT